MGPDWYSFLEAAGGGILVIVLVQTTIERLTARLGIADIRTASMLSMLASVSACTLIHVHYLGARPFPNLITAPVLLVVCLLCIALMTLLPGNQRPAPPSIDQQFSM